MRTVLHKAIRFGLHPLALAAALGIWWSFGQGMESVLVVFVALQLGLWVLQRLAPAKPDWQQSPLETIALLAAAIALTFATGAFSEMHEALIGATGWRINDGGLAAWPLPVQIVLIFFGSDLIYYWIHRAIHRWPLFWRISGHGMHHAFQRPHAANAGVTHPLEALWLAMPVALIATLFGPSQEALTGAIVLLTTNASLAHANLAMATPGLRWFITSSDQHRRHHSVVFEESNSNYACNAIIWDRLFGTYAEGPVAQTGIGPHQPDAVALLALPFREPADADTVATRKSL